MNKTFDKIAQKLFPDNNDVLTGYDINSLPRDVLEEILLRLPGIMLCKKAILVCKYWKSIIDSEEFWVKKAVLDGRFSAKMFDYLHQSGICTAKSLYFKNPFERNLIKNSCGDDRYLHWCFKSERKRFQNFDLLKKYVGNQNLMDNYAKHSNVSSYHAETIGWEIQEETCGSKPINDEVTQKPLRKFATTYFTGQRFQVIDLYAEGINEIILNNLKPKIEISEYYAARFDCGSEYQIWVALLNKKFEQVDFFTFNDEIPQWNDSEWQKVSHVFENYPTDVRYIVYYNYGKDTQFWAGFYGIKMTKSSVKILFK